MNTPLLYKSRHGSNLQSKDAALYEAIGDMATGLNMSSMRLQELYFEDDPEIVNMVNIELECLKV